MDQSILMNTYVNKNTKGGDIRDYPWQAHARLDICNFFNALLECETFKLLPGIAAGFGQFGKNIG
jgi:hypothetical protein